MDDGRFDDFMRRLAVVSTRRVPVRGLAGAALTAVLMQLGPAEPKAKKGKKNNKGKKKKKKGQGQCATPNKECTVTAECCGELVCGSEDRCCAPIPAACGSHAECCLGLCETDDEGRPRCCLPDGSVCNLGRLCCSGSCLDNTCAPSDPGPTCLDPGQVCEGTDECCGELICSQAVNECCAPLGGVCLSHEDCCVGDCETDNDGEPRCCSPEGAFCNLARECCSGDCLPNHTCAASVPSCDPICIANGEACAGDEECCSAFCGEGADVVCCVPDNGACINASDCCRHGNGTTDCESFNGAKRCCGLDGAPCGGNFGAPATPCCPGTSCQAATCTALP